MKIGGFGKFGRGRCKVFFFFMSLFVMFVCGGKKWLFVHKWSSLSCGSAGRTASMWWWWRRRLGEKMSLPGWRKTKFPPPLWRSVRHSQVKSAKHSGTFGFYKNKIQLRTKVAELCRTRTTAPRWDRGRVGAGDGERGLGLGRGAVYLSF